MEADKKLLGQVLQYLRAHGYPDEAFALEWQVSKKHRADLAVVDVDTGTPIALIELKASDAEASLKMGREQLRNLHRELGRDVLLFLAYPRGADLALCIERVLPELNAAETAAPRSVPPFAIAQSSQRTKAQASLVSERKRSVDKFALTCWLAATILIILGVLDYLAVLQMTAERLTLLGIVVTLVVLPFASKLKFLGWEFQRNQRQRMDHEDGTAA